LIKAKRSQKLVNLYTKKGEGQWWSFGVPNHEKEIIIFIRRCCRHDVTDLQNFFSKTKFKAVSVT